MKLIKLIKITLIPVIGTFVAISLLKNDSVINDSGISVFKDHEIIWINNEKLLFSKGILTCSNESGGSHATLTFFEYDVKNNNGKFYDKFELVHCHYKNKIIYTQMQGCSDRNKTYSANFYDRNDRYELSTSYINSISCTPEQLPSIAGDDYNKNVKIELADGLGTVVGSMPGLIYNKYKTNYTSMASTWYHEKETSIYPVALNTSFNSSEIGLNRENFEPWIDEEYNVQILRYEEFKKAYLIALKPQNQSHDRDRHYKYWWLYPDGKIESIIEFNQSDNDVFKFIDGDLIPTKSGLFIVGGADKNSILPEYSAHHGLYSINNNAHFKQVFNGDIKNASVSPNGCKLAFFRMPQIFDPKNEDGITATYYLQTINVCDLKNG